jgi:site-specific DNA-methyltransferase (adenine-specific)
VATDGTNTSTRWNRFGQRFDRYKTTGNNTQPLRQICKVSITPPHNTQNNSELAEQAALGQKSTPKKIIGWDVAPTAEYFAELFRVTKNQIIWGANYFPNMPPTRCFIVWRKLTISEKFSMAMAEYAWTSFQANAKVFECAPQGKKNDVRFHPTQKPIALYKWLLANYAKEGDTILDTHLGSGSSAIACADMGFTMTGIEIDEYYYQKARERLLRHTAQLTLF